MPERECVCVCVGGGIRRVLAGRKWRTLRFGYEELESICGGGELKQSEKRKDGAGRGDGRRDGSDATGERKVNAQKKTKRQVHDKKEDK